MIKAQEHLSYKERMVELGLFNLGKKKLGGAYQWEGRWRRWSQALLSNIQCSDLFPRKAIETPSLEIFKTQVDTVLDSLLWHCSEQRSQTRWSPEIPLNTNHSVNVQNLWFCVKQPSFQMFITAFCTAESTQTLQETHWQAKATPAIVQAVLTHYCLPLIVHVWFVQVVNIAPNREGPTSLWIIF